MSDKTTPTYLTHAAGAPVSDNLNIQTAGPRGPALLQDVWLIEKLAHFDREVIPERRMHAKGAGAHGSFTVTHDITRYSKAKIFSEIGKQTPMFARFSTVAGERGAADAERDIRGFALKFYTEEGNWDMVGNNTPVFFVDRSLTLTGGDLWNVLTSAEIRRERAAELFAQIRAGEVRPEIAARYALSEGAEAHRFLESRNAIGKILMNC